MRAFVSVLALLGALRGGACAVPRRGPVRDSWTFRSLPPRAGTPERLPRVEVAVESRTARDFGITAVEALLFEDRNGDGRAQSEEVRGRREGRLAVPSSFWATTDWRLPAPGAELWIQVTAESTRGRVVHAWPLVAPG